jgi:hypothetical protein
MGHATIAIRLHLYGHLMPGAESDAMAQLEAYLIREIGTGSDAESGPSVPQAVPQSTEMAL